MPGLGPRNKCIHNNIIRGVNGSFSDHQLIILEPLLESHSSCPKVSCHENISPNHGTFARVQNSWNREEIAVVGSS